MSEDNNKGKDGNHPNKWWFAVPFAIIIAAIIGREDLVNFINDEHNHNDARTITLMATTHNSHDSAELYADQIDTTLPGLLEDAGIQVDLI